MNRKTALCVAVIGLLPIGAQPALALDPALDVSQYAHTAWRVTERFVDGTIYPMAQTQDGYLWLGTLAGMTRFDGVKNTAWQPPAGMALPDERVSALRAAHDDKLWIGTLRGLAIWDGTSLTTNSRLDGAMIRDIQEDRDGTIWLTVSAESGNLLCTIRSGSTECRSTRQSYLYAAKDGSVWLAGVNGLERWRDGAVTRYESPTPLTGTPQSIGETASGTILALSRTGILQLVGDRLEPLALPPAVRQIVPTMLFRDRDDGLWIGTRSSGLLHLHQGRLDAFTRADGLSSDSVTRIFEDREGTIWVATEDGLDRFRALAAVTYGPAQSVPQLVASVVSDSAGGIWLSTIEGLRRWQDGRVIAYRSGKDSAATPVPSGDEVLVAGLPESAASLFRDRLGRLWIGSMTGFGVLEGRRFVGIEGIPGGYVDGIAEDSDGNIWVLHRDLGLLRLSPDLQVTPFPAADAVNKFDMRLAADSAHGGVWLGSYWGGVAHFVDGALRETYSAADGLGKGMVTQLEVAPDGTLWAATEGGLSRIKDGRLAPAAFKGWAEAVDRGEAPAKVQAALFDGSDGARSIQIPQGTFAPHIARNRDGKLWLRVSLGVVTVDPHHLPFNPLPPPVQFERVIGDRETYAPVDHLALPPLLRDLEIDYTALSLVAPEKMRFRYRLEGHDRDWRDAGDRRQAFYADLAPGNYRFRVIASNNSGVWNEEGASLAFSIAPAYWQTNWFVALCSAAVVGLLAALYHWRRRQRARAAAIKRRYREMRLELAHANRLSTIGQLTASIAHEVNQPLAATIMQANAALRWLGAEPPNWERLRHTLTEIVGTSSRAADIVAGIRALVKKGPAYEGDVEVNGEIKGVVAMTANEAAKHGIALRTELSPGLPFVWGDRVQLQQLLLNLIVNAIEAMGSMGEGRRELVVRSAGDADGVVLSVCDTGPGIDLAILDTVFEPFHTTKATGLGLGLSICRSIVEAHGGRLWVTANTPRGAIFHIALPGHADSAVAREAS